tara:strand:- start:90919 stop:91161 length:243 start_codon:yes stop_codon:yes gene_type:complete
MNYPKQTIAGIEFERLDIGRGKPQFYFAGYKIAGICDKKTAAIWYDDGKRWVLVKKGFRSVHNAARYLNKILNKDFVAFK